MTDFQAIKPKKDMEFVVDEVYEFRKTLRRFEEEIKNIYTYKSESMDRMESAELRINDFINFMHKRVDSYNVWTWSVTAMLILDIGLRTMGVLT